MLTRRDFIRQSALGAGTLLLPDALMADAKTKSKIKRPNVVYVFADQWRAQDAGFAGNKDVYTPNVDRLASESLNFRYAVSCMPVSTPYRASLLTGQYALTHGLFLNDLTLNPAAKTIGASCLKAGYDTAYIGKWHIHGNGRSNYVPQSHRHGFEYFKALECTHDYNHSKYYDNTDENVKTWEGYDMFAQTGDATAYIRQHAQKEKPFLLVLSWGPPHNPYETAPQKFKDMYKNRDITLRPNVPEKAKQQAMDNIKGYYAHISAMDDCIGDLQQTIRETGIEDDTIFVLTSDHGDMLGSQGMQRKQRPYDESILVPFLLKYPKVFGKKGKTVDTLLNTPDIMPTLLSMSGLSIPNTVEGNDLFPILSGKKKDNIEAALIQCVSPFGEWERRHGGKEYRGIRTRRYTYVKDLAGAWLLFDNETDPYQMNNLVDNTDYADIRKNLDTVLIKMLQKRNDQFLTGPEYIAKWGYTVNANGTVDYIN